MEERLQKILAQAGFGSRRSCEELIVARRVRVNGKIAELGSRADVTKDSISVDGQSIPKIAAHMYIAVNKPRDVLSDIDPEDPRQTVHDLVKVPGHLFAVGRLDYDSEGLILMTNDGELANRLTHPRYGHEKEYHVLVANRPDDEQLAAWRRGVVMADGYRTRPAEVFIDSLAGKGAWLRVVLREGRKRQIREVGSRIGLPVLRIMRVRIGTLLLGDLKVGEWRYLTTDEVRRLRSTVEKPVRNTQPHSNYGQTRSERRPDRDRGPATDEARPPRKFAFRKDIEESRSHHKPTTTSRAPGERSAWKPAPRTQDGAERGEWQPVARPKSSEDRPVRKLSSWPRRGAESTDRQPEGRPDSTVPDTDRKPRSWQKPGSSSAPRPDRAGPDSDRKPRTWQKPGGGSAPRPENAGPDSERGPRTYQKRGGNPADHRNTSTAHHDQPSGRPGGRTKGPRTPRG